MRHVGSASGDGRMTHRVATHVGQGVRGGSFVIVRARVDAVHRESAGLGHIIVAGRHGCTLRFVVTADQATIQKCRPGRHGGYQQQRQDTQCSHGGMIPHATYVEAGLQTRPVLDPPELSGLKTRRHASRAKKSVGTVLNRLAL